MLQPLIKKNDSLAKWLIWIVSFVVFALVVLISKVKLDVNLGFNIHVLAAVNAVLNSAVAVLLVAGLIAVKKGNYEAHKKIMFVAIILSTIFLLSYVAHHVLSSETKFGGVGSIRYVYFILLITHIFLAAVILPFILFTAYRALIAEWPAHRKIAKITWPIWLYVSITGPIVYLMISPYYN